MITLRIGKKSIDWKCERKIRKWLAQFKPTAKVDVFVDGVYFDTCEIQDIFNEAR